MNPEQLNLNPKSEKEILWEQKLSEVNEIADSLGKGVDEKIKKTVAIFLAHEFTTSGSCEGHTIKDGETEYGLPFPWVEVYAPEPEGWKESEEKQQEWMIENLSQQKKMMSFLEEFYKERTTPFDARLTFEGIGAYGGFRVQSFGAEILAILTTEEQKLKLELYRNELDDFTEFLKDKYFAKESFNN
ncbi:MAG: hypothetical protein AAB453_01925 [Patescibacteria group bacterium]